MSKRKKWLLMLSTAIAISLVALNAYAGDPTGAISLKK